jgi:hypothetical protein
MPVARGAGQDLVGRARAVSVLKGDLEARSTTGSVKIRLVRYELNRPRAAVSLPSTVSAHFGFRPQNAIVGVPNARATGKSVGLPETARIVVAIAAVVGSAAAAERRVALVLGVGDCCARVPVAPMAPLWLFHGPGRDRGGRPG